MNYTIRTIFKSTILITFFVYNTGARAQTSIVLNVIDKLENYKSISYQFTNKRRDYTIDTVIRQNKEFFLKAPADTVFGYLFKLETVYKTEHFIETDLYNGKNLIYINPETGIYDIQRIKPAIFMGTLLGNLKWIKYFIAQHPSRISQATDTTINGIINTHLIINTYDSLTKNDHYYTRKHLFIDRQLGVPTALITQSRSILAGGVNNYYDEIQYSDYKFDQANINLGFFSVPAGFHLPKDDPDPLPLLTPGTVAPNWTLYTTEGKKTSLTQLKGKVVLLDFYFIGCTGCMLSLGPLNNLYEKYKASDVVIASLTPRDSQKSVLAFDKQYGIKYPGYVDAADAVKSYHVVGFPTFYFIDKDGKIAGAFVGYSDNFEAKTTTLIDKLLNQL